MHKNADSQLRIRYPRFADDMWYSGVTPQLESDVADYLAQAPAPAQLSQLMGLIAPHAGYLFSGHVAGASFASLESKRFKTVILLGPDHRGAAPGRISTRAVDVWRTPLGDIPVDWAILEALEADIELARLTMDQEHALEIELPFLQATLGQFKLVPLMLGDQSAATCRRLAEALVRALAETEAEAPLLVASSDLSHYFNEDRAHQLDQATLAYILDLDGDGLIRHVEAGRSQGQPFACGAGAIATVIYAAKAGGANQAELLKYATSADVHPRRDRVVGYAAVAFGQAEA